MRILAVRARNLASIPGFELDLANGPLAKTRIFAITGPTGAGKSTLLDALCLALYDRAPRLEGARDVAAGELEIAATDPRSLMRRGASDATAEVDFLGNDGARYRATWEVWRAHKRVEGKLQNQRMRFYAMDAKRDLTGATKTETLARIQETIGLSFSEFRRAVLLAQGDFAAFLEARPDQRAELLEKMTGTEIYAEISRAAFLRAKIEEEHLRSLESERAGQHVLPAERRAQLERERAGLAAERGALEPQIEAARRAAQWHEDHARLSREHEDARVLLERTREAWTAAEPERATISAAAEAEKLRPAFDACTRAARFVEELDARAQAASADLAALVTKRDELAVRAAEAEVLSARAEEAAVRARPDLERAKMLDVQIEEAARAHEEVKSENGAAAKALAEARKNAGNLELAVEREERARAAAAAWIEAHRGVERLAAQWPRWKDELERLGASHTEERRLRDLAQPAARALERAREVLRASTDAWTAAEARARACGEATRVARVALEQHRAKCAPSGTRDAVERIARELASLEAMKVLSSETRRLARQIADEERAAVVEKKSAAEKRDDVKKLREKRRELEAKVETLRDERDRAEAERDLGARRHELLKPGEPCPLCGSKEHPSADEEPEKSSKHRAVKRRLERAERELEETRLELQSTDEAALRHAESAERSRAHADELAPELEKREREWRTRSEAIELLWVDSPVLAARGVARISLILPESADAKNAALDLDRASAHLEEHRAALRELLAIDEGLVRELEDRADALELAERAKRDLEPSHTEAREREAGAAEKSARLASELAVVEARARESIAVLAQPLSARAEWREELARDPGEMLAACAREVEEWESKQSERIHLEESLRARRAELELSAAESARRAEDERRTRAVMEQRRERLDVLGTERRGLLAGRPAVEVARELEEKIARSREEAQAARARATQAVADAQAKEERARHLAHEREGAAKDRADVEMRLAAELGGSTFGSEGRAELTRVLALDRIELERLRRRVALLAEELARLETTLADRRRRLEEHEEKADEIRVAELLAAKARSALNAERTRPSSASSGDEAPPTSTEESAAATSETESAAGASAASAGAAERVRGLIVALEGALRAKIEAEARAAQAISHDDAVRARIAALAPAIEKQRSTVDRWAELNALIGSADGKKLRTFAQGLTLDHLLDHANAHLAELRPRYRLQRIAGHDMELAVVDGDMGDEVRAVATLSGGETFLVSLSLALGLSTLSAKEVSIRSLFIDEGFGSLDRETLEIALATLDRLQAEGRTIGLISHVPDLAERIGYQVHVRPTGPGRSEVVVLEA